MVGWKISVAAAVDYENSPSKKASKMVTCRIAAKK
jgi:hypothetical protein